MVILRLSPGRTALTFFGWTPGLRRLVTGHLLDCGCLAGIYETKEAAFVTIIDHPGKRCTVSHHTVNRVIDAGTSALAEVRSERNVSVNVVALRR